MIKVTSGLEYHVFIWGNWRLINGELESYFIKSVKKIVFTLQF